MEKTEFNKLFGSYIRMVRTEKKLSQVDVAAEMSINAQNISEIERGLVSPTLYWIDRLSFALKEDPQEFITKFYQFKNH